jgi:hypothetical protein
MGTLKKEMTDKGRKPDAKSREFISQMILRKNQTELSIP